MRITGGQLAGRRIAVPRGDVRPSSDRVRESVFAILGDLSEAAVLDLCAGSGALGFEALSRGAASLVAVDRAAAAIGQIRANARTLGVEERVRTLRADALAALTRLGREEARFDLVLLDPPYAAGLYETLLARAAQSAILGQGCQLVVESDRRHPVGRVAALEREDERRYGDTLITFYRAGATTPAAAQED